MPSVTAVIITPLRNLLRHRLRQAKDEIMVLKIIFFLMRTVGTVRDLSVSKNSKDLKIRHLQSIQFYIYTIYGYFYFSFGQVATCPYQQPN